MSSAGSVVYWRESTETQSETIFGAFRARPKRHADRGGYMTNATNVQRKTLADKRRVINGLLNAIVTARCVRARFARDVAHAPGAK